MAPKWNWRPLLYVIFAQVLNFILAWGFYGYLVSRGPVALSPAAAQNVLEHSQSVSFIVTAVSNALAFLSSHAFSQAVRQALVIFLNTNDGMRLGRLDVGIKLQTGSIIWALSSWLPVSLIFFVTTGLQTPGWTAMFTPGPVVLTTALSGTELDFTSSGFRGQDADDYVTAIFAPQVLQWPQNAQASGTAATFSSIGILSTFAFDGFTFNGSSGGVYPATIQLTDSQSMSRAPVNLLNFSTLPAGLSSNYSVILQGFTADVTCNTVENTVTNTTTQFKTEVTNQGISQVLLGTFNMTCSGQPDASATLFYSSKATVALTCTAPDSSPSRNYSVTIWTNIDPFMYICTVAPKVTTNLVDYGPLINQTLLESKNVSNPGVAETTIFLAVVKHLNLAQGLMDNPFSDSLMTAWNWRNETTDLANQITAAYIKGVFEFCASFLREDFAIGFTGFSTNITRPITGVYRVQTLGWDVARDGVTSIAIILPITFVAVTSVLIVLYVNSKATQQFRHPGFDPSNPLDLMVAVSAGGMEEIFEGLGQPTESGLSRSVQLGPTTRKRHGFVEISGDNEGIRLLSSASYGYSRM
ncbi:hypothetical protein M422DRAFT_258763 [Sphaerobolus stellatus SS14]|uniref:Uncharacterized protein n=1 Tax=Sphaerobolus stellatus (strain SS14) TaxID=990650 RepID=A0A0C9VLE1_SPHS4|nr:hypothetical protein M422DRAFT_258763 [Sphaerobolus stellatus SS14]